MPIGRRESSESRHQSGVGQGFLKEIVEQLEKILESQVVLLKRTDNIEKQCKAILVTVAKIEEQLDKPPNPFVTPELESAVKQVAAKAIAIDQQVPDNNQPLGENTSCQ